MYRYTYTHTNIHHTITQVTAVMTKLDIDQSGTIDQNEFLQALLPSQYYSLSASESDLRDHEAVGVSSSEGRLTGKYACVCVCIYVCNLHP